MKKGDVIYYIFLVVTVTIFLIPSKYLVAGYTLSIIGWLWVLILAPSTLILFIWLSIKDARSRNWKSFTVRLAPFLSMVCIYVFWLYSKMQEFG